MPSGIHFETNSTTQGYYADSRMTFLMEDTYLKGNFDITHPCSHASSITWNRVTHALSPWAIGGGGHNGDYANGTSLLSVTFNDSTFLSPRLVNSTRPANVGTVEFNNCDIYAVDYPAGGPAGSGCAGFAPVNIVTTGGSTLTYNTCTFNKYPGHFASEAVFADYPLGHHKVNVATYNGCTFNTEFGPSNFGYSGYTSDSGGPK